MSFVFPELQHGPWKLNEYELGSLATIIGCGSMFGTTIWGGLADAYGRRNVFMITVIFVVIFGIASSFATSFYWLAGLRFWVSFGYGGNIAVDFTLYSEFLPTYGRGNMLFLLTGFWPLGQIFASLLAWAVIPSYGWQVFVAACTIPTMITACARPFIPESPRWLLVQGRHEEATQVCREIAECNGKSFAEVGLDEGCEVYLDNETVGLETGTQAPHQGGCLSPWGVGRFFGPALWRTTLGCLILVAALSYSGYGILTLMPRFLEMKGVSQPNMYRSMVLNSTAELPGVFLATWLATSVGRVLPLQASMFLTGLSLFGFSFASSRVHIAACTMFASCFLESAWALYHVYVPEVYPTDCRAFAVGLLSSMGSVVSIAGPLATAWLMSARDSVFSVIMVFASVAMLAGVSSVFLIHVEPKDRDLVDFTSKQGKTCNKSMD